MKEKHLTLKVADIDYDVNNPRIKKALEKYGTNANDERIYFALRSATEGQPGLSSYNSLKDSIRASGGVMTPITVITKGSRYECIDGNTRLAIYKQLDKESASGDWTKIRARVIFKAEQRDIETIRVSAHLVGAREWPAYEKARYLHYLRDQEFMGYSQMIALCGGKKRDIERQIDAYHDMNEFYRDVVDDSAFQMDRFSGFVELQNRGVKESIFENGFTLKDFGEWIRDGKIFRLEDVRSLKKVLRDEDARKVFIEGGPDSIKQAVQVLEQRKQTEESQSDKKVTLESASPFRLAETLTRRIDDMSYSEIRGLQNKERPESVEQVATLESLVATLQDFLKNVAE